MRILQRCLSWKSVGETYRENNMGSDQIRKIFRRCEEMHVLCMIETVYPISIHGRE